MSPFGAESSRAHAPSPAVALVLLWLAGVGLRLTLLAVPPLLPTIHHALRLSETAVGALTGLPTLVFAAASVPGSLLVARLGARRAVALGLLVVACGGALRGLGQSAPILFAMTVLMSAGIAASQPALPALARAWCGVRSGLATAAYSNGLLIGEIAAAALTAPLLLDLLGGRWDLALGFWSIPVALTALAVLLATPPLTGTAAGGQGRWWPDWRSGRTWRLGLILGPAGIAYFGGNTFIPEYLKVGGHADLIAPALTSLNLAQLPSSLLIAALPDRLIGRRWPLVASGAVIVLAVAGLLGSGGAWVIAWAGLLGAAAGTVFILALALPPLLSEAHDVHRLSAAMFTISYSAAFTGPPLGGALWDLSGRPALAFLPIVAGALLMIILSLGLTMPRGERD